MSADADSPIDPQALQELVQASVARCVRSQLTQFQANARRQVLRDVLRELGGADGKLSATMLAYMARLRSQLALRLADADDQAEAEVGRSLLGIDSRLGRLESALGDGVPALAAQLHALTQAVQDLPRRTPEPKPAEEASFAVGHRLRAVCGEPEVLEEAKPESAVRPAAQPSAAPTSNSRRPYGEGASADSAVARVVDEQQAGQVRFLQNLLQPSQNKPSVEQKLGQRLHRLETRVEEVLRRLGEMATFRPSTQAAKPTPMPQPDAVQRTGSLSPVKSGVLLGLLKQNITFRKNMPSGTGCLPKERKGLLPTAS